MKEFFYFVLVYFAFLLTIKFSGNFRVNIAVIPFLVTLVLFSVYKVGNIRENYQTDNTQIDTQPLLPEQPFNLKNGFQVSPPKLCDGGAYMVSSADPAIKQYCDSLNQDQLDQVACNGGFVGRPVNFKYTPMSDDKWENHMCDKDNEDIYNFGEPAVL